MPPRDAKTSATTSPRSEPAPVAGCDVCGALARQGEEARRAGDAPAVERCITELRDHSHRSRSRR